MKIGASLALICVGAILAFAVTTNTSVFNIHTAGWVLMFIGLIGLFLPRRYSGWLGRRVLVRRTRTWPPDQQGHPGERVEEIPVPPYLSKNPGIARERAGLPPTPTLLHQKAPTKPVDPQSGKPADPGETEVFEDLYEPEQSPFEP
jgi:hypothetical protein